MNRTLNLYINNKSVLNANTWNPTSYNNAYLNAFEYDAMGNILTQQRHKRDGTKIEEMSYKYQYANGKLQRNRLYHINDAVSASVDNTDIDDQGTFDPLSTNINQNNNYKYDEEGRLVRDIAEDIAKITWRVDGKVKEIQRGSDTSKRFIRFDYDAMGHRIAKHVYDNTGIVLKKSTYYILDAQGNQVSMYEHEVQQTVAEFNLVERNMFGSSRIGTRKDNINMLNPEQDSAFAKQLGHKLYEFTNHLGNVLIVFTDVKTPQDLDANGTVDAYRVCLQTITDYSPFGVTLDGRTMQGDGYRYGYQGSEKDDEVKGSGNSYTTHFRQLDPRVGRWLSIDPKASSLSWQTPFCSMDNNPIVFNDPKGDWIPGVYYTKCADDKTGETKKQGILVAYKEKGDNAATLADFMDVSQKEAQKMYSGITSNGMIIANCDAADIINEVINETLNPTGNDYVDDGYIADGWEENYNCWESTLALAKGKEPNYSNCIDQGGFFAKELRNTEKFTNVSEKPSEWNFGETAIRFAETGWTGANFTTHGATYLGTSKNGVVYVWSKEGRVEAPIITTLDKCIENWGEVQGSGPKENEGGFYNSNENP